MSPLRRTTVRVVSACDNRCILCGQPDGSTSPRARADLEREVLAARSESDEITFVGGEPTLHDALPELVALARREGFRAVGVQTNARALGAGRLTARLASAGLTDVHATLHGAAAAVHDYHTASAGSFADSVEGIRSARASQLTVVVNSVLTRSNDRVLSALPPLLAARGVSAWCVSLPHTAGRAVEHFERLAPRLALGIPFALHALESARSLGIESYVSGAPLCLLGPHARHALPSPSRAYGAKCETCRARAICPGLDPAYLQRFGGDELRPLSSAPEAVPSTPLRRMFVGAGELVFDYAVPARRSLPIAPANAG